MGRSYKVWTSLVVQWLRTIFIGRTDAEAEAPVLWPPCSKSRLLEKAPDTGKDWRPEERGMAEEEMVVMASPTRWTWIWANSGRQCRTEEPGSKVAKSWMWLNDWTTTAKCWGEKTEPLRMQKGKQYQYMSLFEETNKRGLAKKKGTCSLWQRRDLPHLAYVSEGEWEAGRELWPLDSCSAFWRGAENEKQLVLFKMNHSLC